LKIVINNYLIEKVLDNKYIEVKPESLQQTPYWDIYCAIEALLYKHVKIYNNDTNEYYDYYPYRKRFLAILESLIS
jgi:hypothetical protein